MMKQDISGHKGNSGGVVLGIHAFTHDSSACLAIDGSLVAYAEQERFSRIKGDGGFPVEAIGFCLKEAGLAPGAITRVIVPFRPRYGALRRLGYRLRYPGRLVSVGSDLISKGFRLSNVGRPLRDMGISVAPEFEDHYACHALSVFLSSPFDQATVLVIDGVAEAWTGSCYFARRQPRVTLDCLKKIVFPQSLGLLYAAVTEHLALSHNRDEGSVMALAAYGDDRYVTDLDDICSYNGRDIVIQQHYFDFGGSWTTPVFEKRFFPRKTSRSGYDEDDFALAHAVQHKVEQVCCALARQYMKEADCFNLCFSGGLALNPVLNGVLLRQSGSRNFYIMPVGGDAGTAVGASLLPFETTDWRLEHAFWGPSYSHSSIESTIEGGHYQVLMRGPESNKRSAELLADGNIGGRFAGRAEMGPRALGHRSILADPRSADIRQRLNDRIKQRAAYRPFAPVLIKDRVPGLAGLIPDSPYMLTTSPLPETLCKMVPAVVHVDGSARVQTVTVHDRSGLYPLLVEFEKLTGLPILLNTSLNCQNEPMANSPEDAMAIFDRAGLDFMLLEDILITNKERQMTFNETE